MEERRPDGDDITMLMSHFVHYILEHTCLSHHNACAARHRVVYDWHASDA